MRTANTPDTHRAETSELRSTGAALVALGAPFAAIGLALCLSGPSVDAAIVLLCGALIAGFGILQVVAPGTLVDTDGLGGARIASRRAERPRRRQAL